MKRAVVSVSVLSVFLAALRGARALPQEIRPEAKPAAQTVSTCSEGWKSIPAKVPGSKVALRLTTTKGGMKQLQWSAHKAELVTQHIRKAKGPANAKGEIETCSVELRISTFTDSNTMSVRDLRDANKLQPGYYVIRVVIGGNDYAEGAKSDWLTLQVE